MNTTEVRVSDTNLEWIFEQLKTMEAQQIAEGNYRDNHSGDSNLEMEQ